MAMREFIDGEGRTWQVFKVEPSIRGGLLSEEFRDGWLAFVLLDGTERCRLSIHDAPSTWQELPDERLDLLRRMAVTDTASRRVIRPD